LQETKIPERDYLQWIDSLSAGAGGFAGFLIVIIGLIIFSEVLARGLLNYSIPWSYDIAIYLFIIFCFIGGAYVLREGMHVSVTILTNKLSKRTRTCLSVVTNALSLLFVLILSHQSILLLSRSFRLNEQFATSIRVYKWVIYAFILIGSFLLILQFIRLIVKEINQLIKGEFEGINTFIDKPWLIIPLFFFMIAGGIFLLKINPVAGILILLLILLFGGVPVAFALGLLGITGSLFLFGGIKFLATVPLNSLKAINNFELICLPLFMMMGQLFQSGKLGSQLFKVNSSFVGHLPGGLPMATIFTCLVFAAISGSSTAVAAAVGLIAIPELIKRGYTKHETYGLVATGGTLGFMIPPSGPMILVALITGLSMGKLFFAGLIPGIMLAGFFSIYLVITSLTKGKFQRLPFVPWSRRLSDLKEAFWALLAPIIVLTGMYTGCFTPVEASAVVSIYTLVVCLASGNLKMHDLNKALADATKPSIMIAWIMMGAISFGQVINMLQIPQSAVSYIGSTAMPSWLILVCIFVLWFIMGMFLEVASILLITLPVVYPVVIALGYNPVWFFVLGVVLMEMALLTPPVGLNLFIIAGITNEDVGIVMRGVLPFIGLLFLGLILLAVFPGISLWLPGTIGP